MRESPSSWIGAIALVLLVASPTTAHRRDEYLQAARVAIDPDRVELGLDLTPGIAVAEGVLAEIDRDGNRIISSGEADAYTARLLRALALDVDGTALALTVLDTAFPPVDAVMKGEGTIRLNAAAPLPRLGSGRHRLRYSNGHRPDIGVYLANALVPASERVTVSSQQRDVDQRELTIEYTLHPGRDTRLRGGLIAGVTAASVLVATTWRRRSRRRPDPGHG